MILWSSHHNRVFKVWFVEVHRSPRCILTGVCHINKTSVPFGEWSILTTIRSWKVITTTKHVFVGKHDQTTAPAWGHECKSSSSLTYQCSHDAKKSCVPSVLLHVLLNELLLGKARWRFSRHHLNARGNSVIIRGSVSVEVTAKPSTVKWFCWLPPEYYLTTTEWKIRQLKYVFLYFDDNH